MHLTAIIEVSVVYSSGIFLFIKRMKKMKKLLQVIVVATFSILLAGCGRGGISNQDGGTLTGGVLGGLLGSQSGQGNGRTAASIGGALRGGCLGGRIGHSMDQQDRQNVAYALEHQPSNRAYTWRNPDSGARYAVTAKPAYKYHQKVCRQYITTAVIDGQAKKVYNTACRNSKGAWINSNRV
jgi:surface antigen